MKGKRITLAAFLGCLAWAASGQHTPLTTQYLYNGLLINPAYAGSRDALTATASYRRQWVGFEGAPTTQVLSVHSPLNAKPLGLGLVVHNDRIGVTRETGVMSNYAYRMRLGPGKLALGLGLGLRMMQADWSQVRTVDPGDVEFAADVRGLVRPDASAGAYFVSARWSAGLSLPYFPVQRPDAESDRWRVGSEARQHQPMFTAAYLINMDRHFKLKPSLLLRKAGDQPAHADLNLNMIWKERFWLGASYRTDDALCVSLLVMPDKQWTIGYAFDMTTSLLRAHQQGSHELLLQYEFSFEVKARDPRYF